MRRKRLLAGGAAAAVAVGVACILLGRAVLAEPGALASARTALGAPAPAAPAVDGGGAGSALLGTGGERSALRAASAAERARTLAAATRAELALAQLASSGPGDRRSWASTLVGVFEIQQAELGGSTAKQHLGAAAAAFAGAIATDPANEDAKRNLELLLTLEQRQRRQQQAQSHQSGRSSHRAVPQAGYASPGWGW